MKKLFPCVFFSKEQNKGKKKIPFNFDLDASYYSGCSLSYLLNFHDASRRLIKVMIILKKKTLFFNLFAVHEYSKKSTVNVRSI